VNTAGTKMIVGFCLMVKKQNTRVKNLRSQKAKKIKIMFDLLGIPMYYIECGGNDAITLTKDMTCLLSKYSMLTN